MLTRVKKQTVPKRTNQGEPDGRSGFRSKNARGIPLPPLAKVYYLTVVALTAAATLAASTIHTESREYGWFTFLILAACAGAAQLFSVRTGRNQRFHTAVVFIVAGALLLPPELLVLMAIVQHLPEWLVKDRKAPWFVAPFNICNYSLNALAAWGTAQLTLHAIPDGTAARWAAAAIAGSIVLVVLNHLLLATMLRLGQGHSFRESELFTGASLAPDLVLAGLGIALAGFWRTNPYLIPTVVAPLLFSQHSFSILALLRESEERFRAMFESAAVGTGLMNADGRIVSSNRALEKLLGYSKNELRQMSLADYSHADDVAAELELFEELFAGKREDYRIEKRYISKDGTVVWAHVAVALVRDADGQPQFGIGMVEDITEAKQAELALRESEERYRELFENANDMVFTLDLAGNFTAVNRKGEQITGYTREELLGTSIEELYVPEDREVALTDFRSTITGQVGGKTREYRIFTKDGRRASIEIATTPIRERGTVVGLQGIARDVSERKELEERLRQAQRMEAVGQLAGGIAHDFNNLLTGITGYTEFALTALQNGDGVVREDIDEIRKAADRASSLTRQLLAFSRKQILQPKILDLNAVVEDTEKMLRRLIGEDIEVVTALGSGLGSVKADPGQIEQVLVNLVVNARDAMLNGGTVTIETSNVEVEGYHSRASAGPVPPGAYVMLRVADTGIGMNEETKARLFEPFFTTKEQGKGTGLGLSTVYGIVKQSGGYVTVESEPGKGTAFKIYLRRLAETKDETEANDTTNPGAVAGSETILLVEDEDIVRRLVRQILERSGYDVIEACEGEEALEILQKAETPIHLLVTDVVMPRMGGAELVERLQSLGSSTKVLFMSGYTDKAIVSEGNLQPGTEFLQKPFTSAALAQKVRSVLDGASAAAA
jgi:two-component system, cell cycle sensor histidine kinase and response regulator CckA